MGQCRRVSSSGENNEVGQSSLIDNPCSNNSDHAAVRCIPIFDIFRRAVTIEEEKLGFRHAEPSICYSDHCRSLLRIAKNRDLIAAGGLQEPHLAEQKGQAANVACQYVGVGAVGYDDNAEGGRHERRSTKGNRARSLLAPRPNPKLSAYSGGAIQAE